MALSNFVVTKDDQSILNGLPGSTVPQNQTIGNLVAHRQILVKGNYKFSRDGGAQGTINLKDEFGNAISLPAGLIVRDGLIVCKTALESLGSPVFDFGVAGGAEFKDDLALTAVDLANEATLIIPVHATASTAVVVGTAGNFTMKIATADVTAGELDVYLECYYRE